MKFQKNIICLSIFALILTSNYFVNADENAGNTSKAKTSSDYIGDTLDLSPGEPSTNAGKIETDNTQTNLSLGFLHNNAGQGDGLSLEAAYKRFYIVDRLNGRKISIDREDYKSGIAIQPGAKFRLDISGTNEAARIDRANVDLSVGSAYRIQYLGGFANYDVSFLPIGLKYANNTAIETTEGGANLGLIKASGHLSFRLNHHKENKEGKSEQVFSLPLELFAAAELLDCTLGQNRILKQDGNTVCKNKLSTGFGVNLGEKVGTLVEEVAISSASMKGKGKIDEFSNKVSLENVAGIDTALGRLNAFWEYRNERAKANGSNDRTISTHVIGVSVAR